VKDLIFSALGLKQVVASAATVGSDEPATARKDNSKRVKYAKDFLMAFMEVRWAMGLPSQGLCPLLLRIVAIALCRLIYSMECGNVPTVDVCYVPVTCDLYVAALQQVPPGDYSARPVRDCHLRGERARPAAPSVAGKHATAWCSPRLLLAAGTLSDKGWGQHGISCAIIHVEKGAWCSLEGGVLVALPWKRCPTLLLTPPGHVPTAVWLQKVAEDIDDRDWRARDAAAAAAAAASTDGGSAVGAVKASPSPAAAASAAAPVPTAGPAAAKSDAAAAATPPAASAPVSAAAAGAEVCEDGV
jgi:hypothetical protein